jgi:hypothetical protein
MVALGRWEEPAAVHQLMAPRINIVNPNCSDQVAITQMSIIKQDPGGPKVIYEGPLIATPLPDTRLIVETLAPHAICNCQLRYCMPVAAPPTSNPAYGFPNPATAAHWLTGANAIIQDIAMYYIEIEWWAEKDAYPPIGLHIQEHLRMNANYTTILSASEITAHFVNLK